MTNKKPLDLRILYTGDARNSLLLEEWADAFHKEGLDVAVWGELLPPGNTAFKIRGQKGSDSLSLRILYQFVTKGLPLAAMCKYFSASSILNLCALKHLLYTSYAFALTGEFKHRLQEEHFHVVHLHYLFQRTTLAFLNLQPPLPPMVYSTWGSDLFIEPNRSKVRFQQFCQMLEMVRVVHTESELQAQYLRRQFNYSGEIAVHSWGINIPGIRELTDKLSPSMWRETLNISTDTLLIVSARKLEKTYRIKLLLEALKYFKKRYPGTRFHCLISSFGSQYNLLFRQVKELKLDKEVTFTGHLPRDKYLALLRQADLYVQLPSSDGISQTILQAMALNTLCITSPAGDNRHLIKPAENGFFFDDNTAEKLAEMIHTVHCLSASEKDRIRENALQMVSHEHSQQKRVAFFSDLYQRLAES